MHAMARLRLAAATVALIAGFASAGHAQSRWNDSATMVLVAHAIAARTLPQGARSGDSALVAYHATAHGYLSFLAQVGPGFPNPPKIVKSDELVLDVYWHTPKLTREVIIGHRDTLLLPTEIGYYNDRFGIIPNDFGNAIRLGEGNDVRDVPHPLAPGGPTMYDYAITDSVHLRTPAGAYDVYEVRVRPRHPEAPRVVGTLYLERASGAIVRMSLTFTRAAILDNRIERLSVTLENALIDGRYWLPKHQSLEVARTSTWLDYPVRGIIRSQWEVCCYDINPRLDLAMLGPEPLIISAPPATLARYPWHGHVLDSIPPDVELVTSADVRQAQTVAQQLLQNAALSRVRGTSLAAHGISDFVRIDRVEGLALGAGISRSLTAAWTASLRAHYGISDHAVKGDADLDFHVSPIWKLQLFGYRSYRDAGDEPETSTLANSVGSELFGEDRTDPYDARGIGIAAVLGTPDALQWRVALQREAQDPLHVHASPLAGYYGGIVPAWSLWDTRASVGLQTPFTHGPLGLTWRGTATITGDWFHRRDSAFAVPNPVVGRGFGTLELTRSFGPDHFVSYTTVAGAAASGTPADIPPQDLVFLGGPSSGPGYGYHQFAALLGGTEHLEWQVPVPVPGIPFWRYGHLTRSATLDPYLHTLYTAQPAPFSATRQPGWYPSAGLGLTGFFNLIRLDVARGFRDGKWTFSIDAVHDFWGLL